MFRFDQEESKNRFEFSEQKRTNLQTLLAEETAEEDTFVWSLLDLMTILLIFFIFIYTQSAGKINSISQMSPPIQEQRSVFQIREQSPQELMAEIPIERGRIPPSASVNIPEPITESSSAAGSISAKASQLSTQYKTEGMDESIEQIREDALRAMDESEDQAFSLRWNQHRLIFVLGERVTFPTGQAKLLESFQPTLQRIASLIASKKGLWLWFPVTRTTPPLKQSNFLQTGNSPQLAPSLLQNPSRKTGLILPAFPFRATQSTAHSTRTPHRQINGPIAALR